MSLSIFVLDTILIDISNVLYILFSNVSID